MKKLIAVMILTTSLHGDQYQEYAGGSGYMQGRTAPCLSPAVALGAIALVAIIAVAVQNGDSGHSH